MFKVKLLHNKEYIRKFIGRKWYEVIISTDKQGRIRVSIPFRWEYKPYNPRSIFPLTLTWRK